MRPYHYHQQLWEVCKLREVHEHTINRSCSIMYTYCSMFHSKFYTISSHQTSLCIAIIIYFIKYCHIIVVRNCSFYLVIPMDNFNFIVILVIIQSLLSNRIINYSSLFIQRLNWKQFISSLSQTKRIKYVDYSVLDYFKIVIKFVQISSSIIRLLHNKTQHVTLKQFTTNQFSVTQTQIISNYIKQNTIIWFICFNSNKFCANIRH